MNLHNNTKFFSDIIRATSQRLSISELFVEKDYWITFVLSNLSKSKHASNAVFKGGTSLSKGFNLINRFSEDVDIAIIEDNKTGNKIKAIIRSIEKEMTQGLSELQVDGLTSKGSKFRKSVFEYAGIDAKDKNNKLIVELNSFSNPFPFKPLLIKSFVFDFLTQTQNEKYIQQYGLKPFEVNVLNKEQTLLEKMASLIRFSFCDNAAEGVSKKIRHFYDLYFLMNDNQCILFSESEKFKKQFNEIFNHDKEIFDEPIGWQKRSVANSPLVTNFENIWDQLKNVYQTELSALVYTKIPNERKVAECFSRLISLIK